MLVMEELKNSKLEINLCFKVGENAAGTFELQIIILHSRYWTEEKVLTNFPSSKVL